MPRADDGEDPDAGWIGGTTRRQRPAAAAGEPLLRPGSETAAASGDEEEGWAVPLLGGRLSIAPEPESPSDEPGKRRVKRCVYKGGACSSALQCSCRCTPVVSAMIILVTFISFGGLIVEVHPKWHLKAPPVGPPPECGTWAVIDGRDSGPGERPCGKCKYGVELTHVVTTDDLNNVANKRYGPCDTLADRYGVPQFEIWNRNKSTSCCDNPLHVEVTDIVDICKPPTVEQWKAEGYPNFPLKMMNFPLKMMDCVLKMMNFGRHPHAAPEKVVFSYIGALGGAIAPLPTWGPTCCQKTGSCKNFEDCRAESHPLPESINVAVIGPIDDTTNNQGIFRVTPPIRGVGGMAANCSVGVNPSVAGRGKTGAGEIDEKRLWLLSLLPLNDAHGFRDNGNWGLRGGGTTLTPEAWGANAAESLEKIILRYRLDGMDLNIEQQRSKFAKYICSMFRHLNARMGPFPPGRGLTFTGTPYSQIWQSHSYQDLATDCPEEVAWINWQTYDDYSGHTLRHPQYIKRAANVFGWNKTTWGISTEHGRPRPLAPAAVSLVEQYPESRGVFVWTAENSAKCSPAWCMEDLISAKMEGTDMPTLQKQCKCMN